MKFYTRSQFASWFENEIKKYLGHSDSWIAPSEYEKAAKLIFGKINNQIVIPSPYGTGGWQSVYRYGEKIWDKNRIWLDNIEITVSNYGSYSSSSSSYSSVSSSKSFYSQNSSSTTTQSNSYSSNSSSTSGIIKRHNFDSALKKIQAFSNQVPYIPDLEKFETDGGLFGLGDHYINGYEMNNYVEKVQNIFKTHNDIIIKTIQEFKDVYNTFDYLDREYLTGIVQNATAAAKASEGARTASNQAKFASEQAKSAADKALKNEEDLKRDVENLRKLVDKIRSIKEDLSTKIETINSSLSLKIQKIEQEISTQRSLKDEINLLNSKIMAIGKLESTVSDLEKVVIDKVDKLGKKTEIQKNSIDELNTRLQKDEKKSASDLLSTPETSSSNKKNRAELIWAYIIGGLGFFFSICSLLFR